jgi:hypothetical protein
MTERQRQFVEALLFGPPGVRYIATRAAEVVGYRWPGKQGPRLLTFPAVNAAVEAGFAAFLAAEGDEEPSETDPECM